MRNSYKTFALLLAMVAGRAHAQSYCSAAALYAYDDEIFNVTFGSLNNSSNCSQTGGAGSQLSLYSNYTGITPPNVMMTMSYPLSVTVGQCNSYAYGGYVGVWIDYNQNGSFTDPGEQVYMSGYTTFQITGTTLAAPNVTIPITATPGITRMRVIANESSQPTPCSTTLYYGEVEDYNVNIISATPCTGTPSANYVVTPSAPICPNASAVVSLGSTYTVGDITYQWQSSTTSSVGPFTAIANATNMAYTTPGLTGTVWYQAVITCTNGMGSTLATVGVVNVEPTITDSVPYFEGFEGISQNNKLPNCSWSSPSIGTTALTYIQSNTLGRNPRTGTKFASFYYTPTGAKYFYTNGIYMEPGITYSAAVWYQTEYYGYNNWTDLSILIGTSQTATGQQTIASTNGPAVSNIYKKLDNTFTVSSPGIYYVAIRATSSSGNASYLSWDDLSITMPCSVNSPSVSLSANNTTVCAGTPVVLTASGADTYNFSTGGTGSQITINPTMSGPYSVTGTKTLTGCSAMQSLYITVKDLPLVSIFSDKIRVCAGNSANLTAHGTAASYAWSNGGSNAVNVVSPTANTTYSVIGTGANGCTSSAMITVSVDPLPTINAGADRSQICVGEGAELTGTGGVTYQWNSSTGVINTNPASVSPKVTTTYTVTGTNANGCSSTAVLSLVVDPCTAIGEQTGTEGINIFPNPNSGLFTVALNGAAGNTIEVTDVTGRVIASQTADSAHAEMNMSGAAAGIYYVKVTTGSTVKVIKVVKQ